MPLPSDAHQFCLECSGHAARIKGVEQCCINLKQKDIEFGKELGGMKKMIFGFLIALLLGVYGNLAFQWKAESDSISTKKLAQEIAAEMAARADTQIHRYNAGP